MNFLSSSPTSSLGSEAYEPVTIIRDELQLQSSFRLRIAWFLSFVLPYTVKRSMDLAGAYSGIVAAGSCDLGPFAANSVGFAGACPFPPVASRLPWSAFLGTQVSYHGRRCRAASSGSGGG